MGDLVLAHQEGNLQRTYCYLVQWRPEAVLGESHGQCAGCHR